MRPHSPGFPQVPVRRRSAANPQQRPLRPVPVVIRQHKLWPSRTSAASSTTRSTSAIVTSTVPRVSSMEPLDDNNDRTPLNDLTNTTSGGGQCASNTHAKISEAKHRKRERE